MLNKIRKVFHLKKMATYMKTETKFWFFACGFMFAERILQDKLVAQVNRDSFMEFFRDDDDDHMGSLSVEDRIEIFRTVLLGSGDFTTKLLNEVLRDYCAHHLIVLDTLLLEAPELENTFTDFFRDYSEDPVALAKYVREYLGVGNETST